MPDTLAFRFRLKRGTSFTLDVDEEVPLDGVTAITGPSGSGKTTLLRALAGLDHDVPGVRELTFRNFPWDDDDIFLPPEDRRVGMVFQEPALFPHLNVEGNIRYGAKRRGVASVDAVIEALELKSMLSRGVTGLSGGEARRVAVARALASDPRLILLDEPMSGLDAGRKGDFLPYIARAVSAAQVPAIYVTHAADEVTALADRVLALKEGRHAGWQAPPMRLTGRVVAAGKRGMQVAVDGAAEAGMTSELIVQVRASIGEIVGLGLPVDSVQLSANHPGRGSALAVFPASVLSQSDPEGRPRLRVFSQELVVPDAIKVPEGVDRLWLSVLRVLPRPQPGDSRT